MLFPSPLNELIAEFRDLPWELKLEYLADYAAQLPRTNQHTADLPFYPVPECQSGLAYSVTLTEANTVRLAFDAADHAVTAHGYLGLLHAGLNGTSPDAIIAITADIPTALGLETNLSAQRLDGLRAVLRRIQATLHGLCTGN